jgi:hypothetical protein
LRRTFVEATHESGQFHKVRDTQQRPPFAHHDFHIRGDQICPLRSHRANGPIIDSQQKPLTVAVVALAHAGELLTAERMKRVRYADKARRNYGNACIPD